MSKKYFHYEGDDIMEQVSQRSCGVSIPEDRQNPTGHRTKACALADPALRRCVGLEDLQRYLPTSKIL